jgi:hypothetical protein
VRESSGREIEWEGGVFEGEIEIESESDEREIESETVRDWDWWERWVKGGVRDFGI